MIEKLNIYSNAPEVINKITVNKNTTDVKTDYDGSMICADNIDASKIENITVLKADISDLNCSLTSIDGLNRA
ncbi:hypothetical protein OSC52_15230 [Clostridium pasteurianum]|uniref:hypothetical protein n=1 Tax=Clostridium pasteurianum TaxID=1501 RepID=UPI002260D845|nr:hypothetical protein [Clostridium pasteurianum]UZW13189.1 hypothetical protein OSC52_15230 [Clostridium pasteurianum]